MKELTELCVEAKKFLPYGCESVKNAFLGGMREGKSWGLRRWLSKNGGALHICSDLENIFQALQNLDREAEKTRQLASHIRPIAARVHGQLIREVPSAYQEISSAHPYLPFFHRLESVLKSLSTFDPDDDDVLIIDDEEELKALKKKGTQDESKRKANNTYEINESTTKKQKHEISNGNEFIGGNIPNFNSKTIQDDKDSIDCEVICITNPSFRSTVDKKNPYTNVNMPIQKYDYSETVSKVPPNSWRCKQCTYLNDGASQHCYMCEIDEDYTPIPVTVKTSNTHPTPTNREYIDIESLFKRIESLASKYDHIKCPNYFMCDAEQFWNQPRNFAYAVRLLAALIRNPAASMMTEPTIQNSNDDFKLNIMKPLCFRDIANALLCTTTAYKGKLMVSLHWNMFNGRDLLEATDLVLLNSLVFYSRNKSSALRPVIIQLRKRFWEDIRSRARDRANMPMKRGEKSGYVVSKRKLHKI